jgi:hypothetical protein
LDCSSLRWSSVVFSAFSVLYFPPSELHETFLIGTWRQTALSKTLLSTTMGIPGLWDVRCLQSSFWCLLIFKLQILRPAEKIISFTELTVKNGFEANGRGTRSFVIGVDAR